MIFVCLCLIQIILLCAVLAELKRLAAALPAPVGENGGEARAQPGGKLGRGGISGAREQRKAQSPRQTSGWTAVGGKAALRMSHPPCGEAFAKEENKQRSEMEVSPQAETKWSGLCEDEEDRLRRRMDEGVTNLMSYEPKVPEVKLP